jgi:hypothetical protein
MKKGDDVADYEEDDAMRTSVSQDRVTVTLRNCFSGLSNYSFLPASDKSNVGGGGGRIEMVNTVYLVVGTGFHISQPDLYAIYMVPNKCRFTYTYFVTGEEDKADFSTHTQKQEGAWQVVWRAETAAPQPPCLILLLTQ